MVDLDVELNSHNNHHTLVQVCYLDQSHVHVDEALNDFVNMWNKQPYHTACNGAINKH